MTGDDLKTLRTQLALTQDEFAERLGVWPNTVWRWENGQRHIPEMVARLVQYVAKEVRAEQKKKKA